jgi:hypothetical protein
MPAATYDLLIEQGATFTFSLEWREHDGSDPPAGPFINTANYDAFMQIRKKPGDEVYASWSSVGDDPEITVVNGFITVYVGADKTDLLTRPGSYDLEMHNRTNPKDVVRLVQGKVKLSLQITEDS